MTATVTQAPSRAEAVGRARELFTVVRGSARQADDERHLPVQTVQAFVASELVRTLVPRRWGGWELDLTTHMEIAIELGRAGGAMGWVGSFAIDHAFILAHFPEQAQADVWTAGDGPDALLSTSFVPVGKVTQVDGGYRLSGDWSWASGVGHASWIMLGGLIHGAGAPQYRLFLVPRSDFSVHDTWFSAGLRGSGSDNVVVEDAFVPEHRTLVMTTMREATSPGGGTVNPGAIYNQPFMAYGGHAMVSPAIGMARGVVDSWQEHTRAKAHSYTHEQVAAALPMQLTLAEATVRIDAAELLLRRALARVDAGESLSLEDRVTHRRDITYAPRLLVAAVNDLIQMAGASGLRDDSPIQRGWRDVRAVACHVFCNFNAAGENYGRMAFGMPLNPLDTNF